MITGRSSILLTAALVILVCTACDRASKYAAQSLRGKAPREYAGGIVVLSYAENRGAMLSIGAGLPERTRFLIFTAGVGAVLAGVAGVLLFAAGLTRGRVIALSLILSGGANNLFDRVTNDGRVRDFVTLGAGSIRTGIFNIADVAIMLGVFLLVFTLSRNQGVHRT
jgi:signal peptidase II